MIQDGELTRLPQSPRTGPGAIKQRQSRRHLKPRGGSVIHTPETGKFKRTRGKAEGTPVPQARSRSRPGKSLEQLSRVTSSKFRVVTAFTRGRHLGDPAQSSPRRPGAGWRAQTILLAPGRDQNGKILCLPFQKNYFFFLTLILGFQAALIINSGFVFTVHYFFYTNAFLVPEFPTVVSGATEMLL